MAALAPLVEGAAADSDPVAVEILEKAGVALALLASAVRRQLWPPGEAVEVAYVGGMFRNRALLEHFRMLVELETGNRCGPPRHGPAEGALLEAYRAMGLDPAIKAT